MTRLPYRPLALRSLAVLLCGAALPSAVGAANALPEGARARLGAARYRHAGTVSWALPLPDGKRLLTMANDHRLHLWDTASGNQELELTVAPPVGSVFTALASDRQTLATVASFDRVIRIWDLATGKEERQFAPLPANQPFYFLTVSADGKTLLSYHQDRVLRFWDAVSGKETRQLPLPLAANPNSTTAGLLVRFMPDGKSLLVVEDWSARVIDAEDGKELRWFGGHTAPITTIGFSPDNKLLATVALDRHARLWDMATGKTVARLPMPVGGGRHLGFDGDGKLLAVGAADRTIRFFDVASAKQVGQLDPGLVAVSTFSLSKDGKTLYLIGSGESVVRSYDVASGRELFPPPGHSGGLSALAWSPDGKTLATAGTADRRIILWDAAAGKMLVRLPALEAHATTHLQFASDGKSLLSYGADRTVRAWDVAAGQEVRSFTACPLASTSFAFSGDGKLAAVSGADRVVRVWDAAEGKELRRLDVKPGPGANFFVALGFAGDNRTLLANLPNERLTRRWDAVSGKELSEVRAPAGVAGLPQGLSADARGYLVFLGPTTNLVELATARVRQTFAPPPAAGAPARLAVGTSAAALSPDGRTLATATTDNVLHFWDTGSGKELIARKGLPTYSRLMAFSPDGKTLATGGLDAAVLLWDVPAPTAEGRLVVKDVTAGRLDGLWKDLAGEDALRAWQAILSLESAPKEVVPFLKQHLKPGPSLDDKAVARLIGQLDAEQFPERERATEELVRAGKAAEEAVKKALEAKPAAEAKQRLEFMLSKMAGKLGPDLEEVRGVRGVEVLERIGTPEARAALEELAGAGESKLGAEARAAADRLKAKSAAP